MCHPYLLWIFYRFSTALREQIQTNMVWCKQKISIFYLSTVSGMGKWLILVGTCKQGQLSGHWWSTPTPFCLLWPFWQFICYMHDTDLSQPVLKLVQQRPCHVLSCQCDNACKRPLAICPKSNALWPLRRLLSAPINLYVLNRDVIQTNKPVRGTQLSAWARVFFFFFSTLFGWDSIREGIY